MLYSEAPKAIEIEITRTVDSLTVGPGRRGAHERRRRGLLGGLPPLFDASRPQRWFSRLVRRYVKTALVFGFGLGAIDVPIHPWPAWVHPTFPPLNSPLN